MAHTTGNRRSETKKNQTIHYTPIQIKILRERWNTDLGKQRCQEISSLLQEGKNNFKNVVAFPENPLLADVAVPPEKDLRGISLNSVIKEKTLLQGFHFSGAQLGCTINSVMFLRSHFEYTEFSGSKIENSIFKGAFFYRTDFYNVSYIQNLDITNAFVDDIEICNKAQFSKFIPSFNDLSYFEKQYTLYALIKQQYKLMGRWDDMIPFHILEMRGRRDDRYRVAAKPKKETVLDPETGKKKTETKPNLDPGTGKEKKVRRIQWYLDLIFFDLLCGYGEKWQNVIASAFMVIMVYSFLYSLAPMLTPDGQTTAYFNYFYFSCVTFSNLGSPDILPSNLAQRFLMFTESLFGLFLVTMIIVIFTRKIIRE